MPPEGNPPALTYPRTRIGPCCGRCWTVNRTPRSCGTESNPQAWTSRAPRPLRRRVVTHTGPVDKFRLASEVDVASAGLGTGGDDRLAVSEVRPDRGDDHAGRLGQARYGRLASDVGIEDLNVDTEPVAQRLQLAAVPPGDRPSGRARPARRQVFRRQGAGEACRAEHDDVQFTPLTGHLQQASDPPGAPATRRNVASRLGWT